MVNEYCFVGKGCGKVGVGVGGGGGNTWKGILEFFLRFIKIILVVCEGGTREVRV